MVYSLDNRGLIAPPFMRDTSAPVVLTLIAILFMVGVYVSDQQNTLLSLALLALSFPVYLAVRKR